MTYHVLIPVKSLSTAKSRLDKYLPRKQLEQLVLDMLTHVISVLRNCKEISSITIVTPDEQIKKYVKHFAVDTLLEEKPGHNAALTYAAKHNLLKTNDALLTISADLPFLKKEDIQQMITLSAKNSIVIARAKDNGTNAILMHPALAIPYLFGKNSFEKYQQEALKRRISIVAYQSESIAFDIDTFDDYMLFKKDLLTISD